MLKQCIKAVSIFLVVLLCVLLLTREQQSVRKAVPNIPKAQAISANIADSNAFSEYTSLSDPELHTYMKDAVYLDLLDKIDTTKYTVLDVQTSYLSKEYLEESEYNSKTNVYFGYSLAELDSKFQGKKYVFTLGEDNKTTVQEFQPYDDTYKKIIRNVVIGTGVILICVTIAVASQGAGAPAVAAVFAASAKGGAIAALSSGAISATAAGITTGMETGDMNQALKSAAVQGSEGFKMGAITGAIAGGASEAFALYGATASGLTMNEVATIQREKKYPLSVIKGFKSMEQYNICKEAGLSPKIVSGKTALVRDIDLNYVDIEKGKTNLERMMEGSAALDPEGNPYELHHIGQQMDSTLAIMTREEHRGKMNFLINHTVGKESEIDRAVFDKTRENFWKNIAKGLIK